MRARSRGGERAQAAEAGWHAGVADRARALLDEARRSTADSETLLDIEELAGHIATRCGLVMSGHAILTASAQRAGPERAVAVLAEAAARASTPATRPRCSR